MNEMATSPMLRISSNISRWRFHANLNFMACLLQYYWINESVQSDQNDHNYCRSHSVDTQKFLIILWSTEYCLEKLYSKNFKKKDSFADGSWKN